MIENIRRYTGLIFIVIVLLLLGFVFMDTSGFFRRSGTGGTVVTIDGRAYSLSEFQKLAGSPHELMARTFGNDGFFFPFRSALAGDAESEENRRIQFFTGRIILREARDEFGVHPTNEDVEEAVRDIFTLPAPGSPPGTPGTFNQELLNSFLQNTLGSYGMVERDFRDLVRDVLAFQEIGNIIGGGLEGDRHVAESMVLENAQEIEASVAAIEMAPFRERVDPSDEDLRSWWESRKDAYMTEPRAKISYLLVTPEYPEEPEEEASADAAGQTEEENAGEEAAEQKRAEERKAIDLKVAADTDALMTRIYESEGEDFDKAAADLGLEIKKTDWITASTLPAEIDLRTRSSATGTRVADVIFSLTTGPDPLAPFSDAVPVGDAQFLVVRLDEFEPARQKTFEEARDEVREQYIAENAAEALEKEVEAKTAALKEAMEGGQSFEEAAKALGLEPRKLGPWGISDSLDNEFNARQIFQLASTVDPGDFAEPFISDDRAVIIHVDRRQIVKDDNRGSRIDAFTNSLQQEAQYAAFDAWLRQQINEAQVALPQRP